jgi:hypothetical protein
VRLNLVGRIYFATMREMQKPAMFYPLLLLVFWTGLMITADSVVIATSVRQARSVDFATTTGKMVQSQVGKGAMSHRGVEMGEKEDRSLPAPRRIA